MAVEVTGSLLRSGSTFTVAGLDGGAHHPLRVMRNSSEIPFTLNG